MSLILNIETASTNCSVALAQNDELLALKENKEGQSHARVLTTLIEECFHETGFEFGDLNAIAISKGPGSYTGLRIGIATAKGLCYALDLPLLSVNTLQSMAFYFLQLHPAFKNHLLCPMLDARRMEVYTAIFHPDLSLHTPTKALIIQSDSFRDIIHASPIVFFGEGVAKITNVIDYQENITYYRDFSPSAMGMLPFSQELLQMQRFESLAQFEPFYLKDFYSPLHRK